MADLDVVYPSRSAAQRALAASDGTKNRSLQPAAGLANIAADRHWPLHRSAGASAVLTHTPSAAPAAAPATSRCRTCGQL